MANIGVKRSPGSSIPWKTKCGATVITNNTLLTAAHCFKDRSWNGLMVRIGDNIINDTHDDEYLRELEISEVEFHEGYVEGKAQFDIGTFSIHLKSKLISAVLRLEQLFGRSTLGTGWRFKLWRTQTIIEMDFNESN